jgi:FAD/FMN-containing dehydrogenase
VWQTGFAGLPGPDPALIEDLRGAGDVSADPDVLASYRHDQAAPGLLAADVPAALVRPRTTAEVQAAMRAAARHGVAGGLCCVKYGVTRDSLLELELVLADGRALRLGHRTRKGVAGYELAGLICGSEGTLGIITEVTAPADPAVPASTLAATFADSARRWRRDRGDRAPGPPLAAGASSGSSLFAGASTPPAPRRSG